MNTRARRRWESAKGPVLTVLLFALMLSLGVYLLGGVSESGQKRQTEYLRAAVRRAVITCYAVEGRYPVSADYLRENYGLRYDANRYVIRLDAFASNVAPDIVVLEKGAGGAR